MLSTIKQHLDRDDEQGFTLIELMVVVLIIAILLAIAIPTFLGARNSANARAAQSNLNTALTAEQTEWTNAQTFSSTGATMQAIEAAVTWVAGGTGAVVPATTSGTAVGDYTGSGGSQVMATVGSDTAIVVLTDLGADGNCWSVAQVNDPTDSAFEGTSYAKTAKNSSGACAAPTAPAAAPTSGSAGGNAATTAASPTWYTTF
jgi:type IV pilus assembly protein PilA